MKALLTRFCKPWAVCVKTTTRQAEKPEFQKTDIPCLYRYSSNGVYYAPVKHEGKQKRESSGHFSSGLYILPGQGDEAHPRGFRQGAAASVFFSPSGAFMLRNIRNAQPPYYPGGSLWFGLRGIHGQCCSANLQGRSGSFDHWIQSPASRWKSHRGRCKVCSVIGFFAI